MTVGIVGAGQLGGAGARGYPLATEFLFYDRSTGIAGRASRRTLVGAFDDDLRRACAAAP